jgi:hypothetical protein
MSQRRTPPRPPEFNRLSEDRLTAMIEEATVDCYNESEQLTGCFTMIEENLEVPCESRVAICRRGGEPQAVPILNLPLPSLPPRGSERIEAFRRWLEHG